MKLINVKVDILLFEAYSEELIIITSKSCLMIILKKFDVLNICLHNSNVYLKCSK